MAQSTTLPSLSNSKNKRGRKKRLRNEDKCLVCADQSIGINFGIHCCSPCKTFFRRNAVKLGSYDFVCMKEGDCPITSTTRQLCNCCRLAKCFRMGMNRNAIRTEDENRERTRLIVQNRQKRAEDKQIIRPVNLLQHSHQTFLYLSTTDQTLLTNILRAYDQNSDTIGYRTVIKMRDNDTISLQKLMNSVSGTYLAIVNYFRLIPEFNTLPIQVKAALLKSNLNQIIRLNSAIIIHAAGGREDPDRLALRHTFPADLYRELSRCAIDLFPFVYDPLFMKLILVVLIFSTSLSIRFTVGQSIIYPKNLIAIQDIYIELLWRYILYRSTSYRQSVRLLTTFITRLLHSQVISEKLTEHINKASPDQGNLLEPIMKAMWLDEQEK
ncbi:unnamed protein product [Adineta ricciae]|uniref:Nuclear receptor domain-containing protein n=1 Tax=Adineta ricciae TaxID=249248 RepID=A0A815KQ54_ADIRI|nr:unnamed protein product [Adineta ricciae]